MTATPSTQHTPEPWTWGMQYISKSDYSDYKLIAAHPSGFCQPEGGEWAANARRIVACVNVCCSESTEKLELDYQQGYEPWGHVKHLEQERSAARSRIQSLEELLHECAAVITEKVPADHPYQKIAEQARNLLGQELVGMSKALGHQEGV